LLIDCVLLCWLFRHGHEFLKMLLKQLFCWIHGYPKIIPNFSNDLHALSSSRALFLSHKKDQKTGNCVSFNHNHVIKEWIQPKGFDTGIKVSNHYASLGTRRNRVLVPLIVQNPDEITWYACGPTVYDEAHIGHASSYVRFDTIKRILTNFFNFRVKMVMGMTNVDDKIIARAQLLGKEFLALADFFETRFQKDMSSLNVAQPFRYMRVSDHILEMIKFIEVLLESGNAYITDDGNVWFDTENFTKVGRLISYNEEYDSGESMPGLKITTKSRKDFALWKVAKPGEPYWDAPWGKGRPGWHLECSTMASLVFGNEVDIHSGGRDLCFPHHECELLQSEAYHKCNQWVNYFFHSGDLKITKSSAKMSKSLGNVITISEFLQSWSSDVFRYAVLSLPWHADVVYDSSEFHAVSCQLENIENLFHKCHLYLHGNFNANINDSMVTKLVASSQDEIHKHFCNDFDTPSVLNSLEKIVREVEVMFADEDTQTPVREVKCIKDMVHFLSQSFENLGFVNLTSYKLVQAAGSSIDKVFQSWVDYRYEIRKLALDNIKSPNQSVKKLAKETLSKCDGIRKDLAEQNFRVVDGKDHSTFYKN